MLGQAPHTGLQLLLGQGVEDQVDPCGGKQALVMPGSPTPQPEVRAG